jgi:hypothetical protein
MNDALIRGSFRKKRLNKYETDSNSRIIEELGLNHGTIRADIAVANGILKGYEIKSELDTLERLPKQSEAYSSIFDEVTLIVAAKHLSKAERIVPEWWGICVAEVGTRGAIKFSSYQKPKANKDVNLLSLARLLWRKEAAQLLKQNGIKGSILSQGRETLYQELSNLLDHKALRAFVCDTLKHRPFWRDHLQPS